MIDFELEFQYAEEPAPTRRKTAGSIAQTELHVEAAIYNRGRAGTRTRLYLMEQAG